MSFRISPTVVLTGPQVVANTAHITSNGLTHEAVADATVKSVHAGVSLVTGALNQIDAALNGDAAKLFTPSKAIITCTATDNPAYLVGGAAAETVIATWNAVTLPAATGNFNISIDGVNADVTGLDFALCADMDDVADVIQTGIQAVFAGNPTCVWDTDHFVITSDSTDPAVTAVTVTAAIGAPAGTDISGAGGAYMDSDVGNGIPHLVPAGAAASITIGASHAGTEILPATVMTGLIDMGQAFEVALTGLFPEIAGNALLHVTSTVGDGTALTYLVSVEVQGTQA